MAQADVFIFLDDVQFSKQSYINRVQVLGPKGGYWLTVPVKVSLGQPINAVQPARPDFASSHLDTLKGFYRNAAKFKDGWPTVEALYRSLPEGDIASINRALAESIAARLGLAPKFLSSSEIDTGAKHSTGRLVALTKSVDPEATYLSGKGGAKYQAEDEFARSGVGLRYSNFEPPEYLQGRSPFVGGLSVLDAVFHLGWEATAALISRP